ncbi:hypothetical protein C8Q80DRAFT_125552 [Daedaleopsis nitida]|nr:hypothetical protein C8Q80DRAFT_125552 [Daedaleopsis nitida]
MLVFVQSGEDILGYLSPRFLTWDGIGTSAGQPRLTGTSALHSPFPAERMTISTIPPANEYHRATAFFLHPLQIANVKTEASSQPGGRLVFRVSLLLVEPSEPDHKPGRLVSLKIVHITPDRSARSMQCPKCVEPRSCCRSRTENLRARTHRVPAASESAESETQNRRPPCALGRTSHKPTTAYWDPRTLTCYGRDGMPCCADSRSDVLST